MARPVVLVGCGRLGSAIAEGWLASGAVAAADLIILSPSVKPVMDAARAAGARVNPPIDSLKDARAVVLAIKPAKWREAAAPLIDALADDAVVVSVMAGVRAGALASVFGDRIIGRVMPTTGVARTQGVATIWADSAAGRETAHTLFAPVAETVELAEEALMDVATAVVGAGPAYFYAFTQALAQAGQAAGLDAEAAQQLARATLKSAAGGLPDEMSLSDAVARVASPGGVTQAGLAVLAANGLTATVTDAIRAATDRAVELSRDVPA